MNNCPYDDISTYDGGCFAIFCNYELQTPMVMDASSVMFYPLLFFVLFRHISSTFFLGVSCPLYFIPESWFIHPSPAHLHPFMSRPSYFIPSFFWVLPVIFLPRFFFGSCPSYVIHFFWGPLVCHISSTKVCSFICPPLIARIHVSYVIFHPRKFVYSSVRRSSPLLARILRVRVCLRVACCAFSDGGGCRRIRVFSSGSLTSKKLLICSFSCCFSLEDVVKLSAEARISISAPYISRKFFSNSLYTLFCIATFE